MYTRAGHTQKQNYIGQRVPCSRRLLLGECSRNPSMSVYHLALLWEAVFGFSGFFLKTLFQCICPFPDGWFMNIPAHTVLSVQQFLTKNVMPHPPSLFTWSHPQWLFLFVSLDEKSLQRETFCQCGRGETKIAEALKGFKINKYKNCFEQWKKHFSRCTESNGEYFEGDWSLNM